MCVIFILYLFPFVLSDCAWFLFFLLLFFFIGWKKSTFEMVERCGQHHQFIWRIYSAFSNCLRSNVAHSAMQSVCNRLIDCLSNMRTHWLCGECALRWMQHSQVVCVVVRRNHRKWCVHGTWHTPKLVMTYNVMHSLRAREKSYMWVRMFAIILCLVGHRFLLLLILSFSRVTSSWH